MNKWINYHHLYYFMTIAREGSVSKAAEKLRLGQPTLSAQLKQFEESIGVSLFARQHKKLTLTEQGKVALEYASSIFQMGDEMVEVLNDRLLPARPSLCVGALDHVPKQVVVHLVKQALKIAPCQITLLEGHPDELVRELSSHRIDLLITNFLPNAGSAKKLFHRHLAKNQVRFYGAQKYKMLRKGFPQSLTDQLLILPTHDSRLRYDLDHWAKLHQMNFNVLIESQDIAVKKMMAVNELGLLPVASFAVTQQLLAGELIELGVADGVYEDLYLVSAERKIGNPIAAKLMEKFSI